MDNGENDELHSFSEGDCEGVQCQRKQRLRFRYVKVFKKALRYFRIQNGFDYDYIKNDKKRAMTCCIVEHFNWKIHAS